MRTTRLNSYSYSSYFTDQSNVMIKKPIFLLSALCLALLLSPAAYAGKYYKWVDSEGVTHYGESPPDTETAAVVNVKTGASSDQKQAIEALEAKRKAAEETSNPPQADEESAIEKENRKIMENNCKIQRQNLSQLKANRRVKVTDDNGQIRYLNDDEIQNRQSEIEKYIAENCTGV